MNAFYTVAVGLVGTAALVVLGILAWRGGRRLVRRARQRWAKREPRPAPAPSNAPLEQLVRLRWAARGALYLAAGATLAVNALHAQDNVPSRLISAWAPVAIIITVEILTRAPAGRSWSRRAAVRGSLAVIACVAAWVSYWHAVAVCLRYGEDAVAAHILPLSADGLVVVMSVVLRDLSERIREAQGAERSTAERAAVVDALPPGVAELLPAAMDVARGIAPNGTPPSQRQFVTAFRAAGHSVASDNVGPLHAAVTAQWSAP